MCNEHQQLEAVYSWDLFKALIGSGVSVFVPKSIPTYGHTSNNPGSFNLKLEIEHNLESRHGDPRHTPSMSGAKNIRVI
jgi:hypothetical protein